MFLHLGPATAWVLWKDPDQSSKVTELFQFSWQCTWDCHFPQYAFVRSWRELRSGERSCPLQWHAVTISSPTWAGWDQKEFWRAPPANALIGCRTGRSAPIVNTDNGLG
ncbi:hypothetical protein TNCT_32621 [Trichonephila clavata]|uniref:Uncharacterized protein n=1 Tax=Trichonephila clavata TaxID=2740835 RepID=A0A8X6GX87_TRICU|nr:hypothetical protein TNCT_32621 [Trichonephila clavata]